MWISSIMFEYKADLRFYFKVSNGNVIDTGTTTLLVMVSGPAPDCLPVSQDYGPERTTTNDVLLQT
ncbi:hypothetical protein MSG28_003485 [Choristoneura fumiferana]|uniref:Uncharacterized protein n=1 Tax=Choristoneura fumiferana TaxID=7141 RepID=A0ACC0KEZ4_CHOFU|nr:hypothetical protein MSG28_003485 [Choristoneura fumiferana]